MISQTPSPSASRTRIKHPASTNFQDDQDYPARKRLKRFVSIESSHSTDSSAEGDSGVNTPENEVPVTPDSRAEDVKNEGDDERAFSNTGHGTDLESALPPIKTDKDAIEDYEASRRAQQGVDLTLDERLEKRKWVRGKSSIYVDAFNLALETVLQDEVHLFDEAEQVLFKTWQELPYEAQYLYVRLFLRKTSLWHRINRLGYYSDIADLPAAVEILQASRPLPTPSTTPQVNPGELEPPEGQTLGGSFSFAEGSGDKITTLEEASSLLNLDELKALAKDGKIQGKNKTDLLKALRRTSKEQGGLRFGSLQRTESEETTISHGAKEEGESPQSVEEARSNRDGYFVGKILDNTGPCIKLALAPLKLFERVHLVFYRSTEWTEKSLTTIILARISRRNFPQYIISRSANIFPSRPLLLEFEAAIRTQFRVDNILEFNGNPTQDGLQQVLEIFEQVYPRWQALLEEEQRKEVGLYESGEGAYLRRFSPAWVYTRIIHKGSYVLGRLKLHKREHEILSELLSQKLFHAARRGAWYQRKALIEEHYMCNLSSNEGRDPEAQKKYWKRIALRTCEEGLRDCDCHLTYHYDLQKRICKLEKSLRVAKREQHDFGHVSLVKPVERTVEGIRVQREDSVTHNGRRKSEANGPISVRGGGKTIWIDEREGGGECSVEEMCLSWYRSQGWKGYHSEGGIVRTLFAYLFYDILFVYIPNVFQTPYQTCPLDLHTDSFYPSRLSEINHRLVEISNGAAADLIRSVHERESASETCIVGLDWSFAFNDLLEMVDCFENEALATICKVLAQEYRQRGGGIPDLFLWNPQENKVLFAEVKSENDRLSDTQRLWIHVLTAAGVKVELCNAVAREIITTLFPTITAVDDANFRQNIGKAGRLPFWYISAFTQRLSIRIWFEEDSQYTILP
ncbi:MAG: hypothetical protein M1816_006145 [Peltula sp. TS41687]|nr:MAG: hypothetical protein M1816_006145 [Peltula sp. TS41687]